jgi:hypothetical protein
MGFASESGYTPLSIETIMLDVMDNFNTQFGTTYTQETFLGTSAYKYFYALVQRLQANEVRTGEIFSKLQQYIEVTNERILRPSVTPPGLVDAFIDSDFVASVKPPIDADAGKIYVCVDTDETADDYADVKLEINTIIKNSVVAGVVSQGTETSAIVLSNGQSFDFKFNLPDRNEILLRLTITLSENNQSLISTPEEIKNLLVANIAEKYSLGKNFEPQRYFTTEDAPWASDVMLEWSDDAGSNYYTTVFDAAYDDLFVVLLENIELIEA